MAAHSFSTATTWWGSCRRVTWPGCSMPAPTAPGAGPPPETSVADFQQQLARVLAAEELGQRLRKILDAVDDVFARLQLSFMHPLRYVDDGFGIARRIVEHHESLHARTIDQQRHVVGGAAE